VNEGERRRRSGQNRHRGLAQALSNRGRRGRKKDFRDAERLVKRLVARELTLRFVPDVEQRLWRTVTRRKYQLTRDRARLQNQVESLLEEAHIKLSSLVSDLLGASARRMYLRNCLSALGPAPRTPPSHRGHCPSTVSVDLLDLAPKNPLRGTRSSGYQTISASTHRQNDPPTPQTRLPSRTTKFATR
jgi:hypothetical protein